MTKLLKIEQVADILGCTHWTIRNYIRKGILNPIRLTNSPKARIRFKEQDIENFMANITSRAE